MTDRFDEILRRLTVTDEMIERAMVESSVWADPHHAMEQALVAAIKPAREYILEDR